LVLRCFGVFHPVVQQVGTQGRMDPNRAMSAALARLGRNPRDVEALLQAGDPLWRWVIRRRLLVF
jgi:hypothetical protein